MSAAWYIVLERRIPGLDVGVNGKALSKARETIETMADELGVQRLMHFYSISRNELALAEEHDIRVREHTENWFSAEEGLRTVRALILRTASTGMEQRDMVLSDLREFERVLEGAMAKGVRWHLAVDF